jgi:hypothetical protein
MFQVMHCFVFLHCGVFDIEYIFKLLAEVFTPVLLQLKVSKCIEAEVQILSVSAVT